MKQQNRTFQRLAIGLTLILFIISTHSTKAQDKAWNANWIWSSDQGPNNTWINFRKKVTLNGKPNSAVTRIAAENKYWLFVNDVIVVRDGGLETRPDLDNTYYDEIDLAPFLKGGDNIISALVWHKGGPECYTQRTLADGGFLFETQLTGSDIDKILSDNSWKIRIDSSYVRGVYAYKYNVSGNVNFNKDAFGGDPIQGIAKAGYYRRAGSSSPFIKCANENESFTLPGNCDVVFGAMESPLRPDNDSKWVAYPVTFDARN